MQERLSDPEEEASSQKGAFQRGWVCNKAWEVTSVVSDSATLWDPSPPGSSVHGILQARILEWVSMPSSRGSSPPRDGTHASLSLLHGQAHSLPLAPLWATVLKARKRLPPPPDLSFTPAVLPLQSCRTGGQPLPVEAGCRGLSLLPPQRPSARPPRTAQAAAGVREGRRGPGPR